MGKDHLEKGQRKTTRWAKTTEERPNRKQEEGGQSQSRKGERENNQMGKGKPREKKKKTITRWAKATKKRGKRKQQDRQRQTKREEKETTTKWANANQERSKENSNKMGKDK